MTVTVWTVGGRIAIAGLAAAATAYFGLYAIGQPLWMLTSGAPVLPHWAIIAWAGPLAGLPMGALAYFAAAAAMGLPAEQNAWEVLARRCLTMGLAGLGLGALWAGAALALALALYGRPSVYVNGEGVVVPMIAILLGLSFVVAINLFRMQTGGVWVALGQIIWGGLGVVALAIGVPMAIDAAAIDDARTLSHRYNLLIVFYPVLWLAFAATAAAIVICGLRWLKFGLSAPQRNEVSPPSTGSTWPVTYEDSPEIRNKAA
jgi:hypothetical protein